MCPLHSQDPVRGKLSFHGGVGALVTYLMLMEMFVYGSASHNFQFNQNIAPIVSFNLQAYVPHRAMRLTRWLQRVSIYA